VYFSFLKDEIGDGIEADVIRKREIGMLLALKQMRNLGIPPHRHNSSLDSGQGGWTLDLLAASMRLSASTRFASSCHANQSPTFIV